MWLFFIFAFSSLVFVDESSAVPAFARKYRMSCTTCHTPFPKLKPYGDDFAGNGFELEDQDAPRYMVETGDEKLDLIRDLPLAIRMEGYLQYQTQTDKDVDYSTPYYLKFISGGKVTDGFAYYFYFYLSEHGEVAGIEDAYVMFNNLFDSELDIYFGQFQVSDPLFKRELRLTYEDYPVYTVSPGKSQISLKYDRGFMITYGFETGTDLIFETVNGNGLVEADDFGVFDNDKYKSFAGRISQDIGEYFRVGGFGYYGKEGTEDINNEVYYYGPDMSVAYATLELNVQYLERSDSDPNLVDYDGDEIETRGAMAELIYLPDGEFSEFYAVGLFNWIESDFEELEYRSLTGHVGHVFRSNLRFFVEYTYEMESEESRVVTGFVGAF
ncbi:MAG: hypothetical protein GF404_11860 [candidate division Zixibacteria bacterium]|nr:hypothetical protein [candidate division Zixibacteria bacterium]